MTGKNPMKISGGMQKVILRRKLVELFGGVCSWNGCTVKEDLEFAHIKPTGVSGSGRGSHIRYKDVRDHPACYKLMCPQHHLEYDTMKGIDLIVW